MASLLSWRGAFFFAVRCALSAVCCPLCAVRRRMKSDYPKRFVTPLLAFLTITPTDHKNYGILVPKGR